MSINVVSSIKFTTPGFGSFHFFNSKGSLFNNYSYLN